MSRVTRHKVQLLGLLLFLALFSVAPASASSANISRSFNSGDNIAAGMLVSFTAESSGSVVPATTQNATKLIGVAVASNDSLLAVDEKRGMAQVATSGSARVLVSDLNGKIAIGDQISVSPLKGVGVKAGAASRIIGTAQSAFSNTSQGAESQRVTDKSGKQMQTSVGYVNVSIAIGSSGNGTDGDKDLTALQRLGKSVTGRVVSTPRLLICAIIAAITMAVMITLVYSTIHAGVMSIGRNPLARYTIFRSIALVLGMVVMLGLISAGTIYILVR